jgi:hypothetical protein
VLKSEVLINLWAFFLTCLLIGIILIFIGIIYPFAFINRLGLIMIGILFLIGSISLFKKIRSLKWG